MSLKRNNSVSYLKALGIMLMVLGHSGHGLLPLQNFIYMFHMPLFFFASGFCFKRKYMNEPFAFLKKRMGGVYVPFVKWGLLFLLLHNILFGIHIYSHDYGYLGVGVEEYNTDRTIDYIWQLFSSMSCHEQLLGGYWFLRSLFFGSLISWLALRICKRPWLSMMTVFSLCIMMNKYVLEIPILHLHSREFAAATIVLLGHCFAYYKIPKFNTYAIITSWLLTALGSVYWFMELSQNSYSNKLFPEYIITAVLTTWSCYSLFEKFKDKEGLPYRILKYLGNNTLTILTCHFASFKIVSLLIILIYDLQIERLAEFPTIEEYSTKGWFLAYLVVGVVVPLTFTFIKHQIVAYTNWYNNKQT